MAEMTVGSFVAKADALRAKGLMAMGSPDMQALQTEMKAVTTAYRSEITAARRAGKKPHSCPPPKGKVQSPELIAHLKTLPPSLGLKAGFYSLMKKKYPCPA